MAEGIRIIAPARASRGIGAAFVGRALLNAPWLVAAGAVIGAVLGMALPRSDDSGAVASLPMALESVGWSETEATHRRLDSWTDENMRSELGLPAITGSVADGDELPPDEVGIDYRLPQDLQITSFSIEVSAPSDGQATSLAEEAGLALQEEQARFANRDIERRREALNQRLANAVEARDDAIDVISGLRSEQLALIDDDAPEAVVSQVTADLWATETERVEWVREVNSTRTELNRLDAEQGASPSTLGILGPARLEQAVAAGSSRTAGILGGAVVGLWLGGIAAYALELRRGRVRTDHPALAQLGVPVSDLGSDGLDSAATLALADAIDNQSMRVSLVDVGHHGTAAALAMVLIETMQLPDGAVRAVGPADDETTMVGTMGMLIAVSGRCRVNQLLERYRRCQDLEVPVARVVLLGRNSEQRLHDWAGKTSVRSS